MKTIGIFYGSSTGTTEDIAKRIAAKLGVDASNRCGEGFSFRSGRL